MIAHFPPQTQFEAARPDSSRRHPRGIEAATDLLFEPGLRRGYTNLTEEATTDGEVPD